MAYSTSNPPSLVAQRVGSGGHTAAGASASGSIWFYQALGEAQADVNTAGYFTNGYDLGMRTGDVVIGVNLTDFTAYIAVVNAASATTGGIDITDGLAIAVTDTD